MRRRKSTMKKSKIRKSIHEKVVKIRKKRMSKRFAPNAFRDRETGIKLNKADWTSS
jgi:hypothetical protein